MSKFSSITIRDTMIKRYKGADIIFKNNPDLREAARSLKKPGEVIIEVNKGIPPYKEVNNELELGVELLMLARLLAEQDGPNNIGYERCKLSKISVNPSIRDRDDREPNPNRKLTREQTIESIKLIFPSLYNSQKLAHDIVAFNILSVDYGVDVTKLCQKELASFLGPLSYVYLMSGLIEAQFNANPQRPQIATLQSSENLINLMQSYLYFDEATQSEIKSGIDRSTRKLVGKINLLLGDVATKEVLLGKDLRTKYYTPNDYDKFKEGLYRLFGRNKYFVPFMVSEKQYDREARKYIEDILDGVLSKPITYSEEDLQNKFSKIICALEYYCDITNEDVEIELSEIAEISVLLKIEACRENRRTALLSLIAQSEKEGQYLAGYHYREMLRGLEGRT